MTTMTNRPRTVKVSNVLEPTADELADVASAFVPLSITSPGESAAEFHRVNGYGNRARVAYAASTSPYDDHAEPEWMAEIDPDWSVLPQVDGSGLSPEEHAKLVHRATKVRREYRLATPDATADELDRVEANARRDALRSILRARPMATVETISTVEPGVTEIVTPGITMIVTPDRSGVAEMATPAAPCCSPDEAAPCVACVNGADTSDAADEDEEDVDTNALEAKHRELMPDYFDARDVQDALEDAEWERKRSIPRFRTMDDFGEVDFTAGNDWTLERVVEMLLDRIARTPDLFTSEWAVWSGRSCMAVIGKRSDGSPFTTWLTETDEDPEDEETEEANTEIDASEPEPLLTLPELIELEADRLRSRGNAAGDLMAKALEDLARVVRTVSAARPDQVDERLAILARDYSDPIDCEPELMPSGRFA